MSIKIEGAKELVARATDDRISRRVLRKALRETAKVVKVRVVAHARAISRRLARRTGLKIDRDLEFALVRNTYAGAHAIEKGRRAGAKMPPAGALAGGVAAARVVARRGLRARPFMAPAAAASAGDVSRVFAETAREMEALWQRGR